MDRDDWVVDPAGVGIGRKQFSRHAHWLARRLPEAEFAINLCADRYNALVGFVAVMLRGQTNLLPPSRAEQELRNMAESFPKSYCLLDHPRVESLGIREVKVELSALDASDEPTSIRVPPDHEAAILFTSGSTGRSQPSSKRWGELYRGVELTCERFGFSGNDSQTIVSTVPSQHMFGLETSALLPWIGGVGIFRGQPFYPRDLYDALSGVASARVLVTTPVHLRACVESDLRWPSCDLILSATAPMPESLAAEAEALFQAPVMEIFGSTETGAIASRRTVQGARWHLYEGVSVRPHEQGVRVQADHLLEPVILKDRIEPLGDRGFRWLGRDGDLIKIAGKRGSLLDLSHKLNQIDGVSEGVFVTLPSRGGPTERLAALVVAPALSKQQILAELARHVDPVFLPRPVVFVDRLPLNQTGKLPHDELLRVFEKSAKVAEGR